MSGQELPVRVPEPAEVPAHGPADVVGVAAGTGGAGEAVVSLPVRAPRPPKYPLDQLTTWELRNYRSELVHALDWLPAGNERVLCAKRLDSVTGEQSAREKAAGLHPSWDGVL